MIGAPPAAPVEMVAMSSVAFDQARADALVNEIGQKIVADANYAGRDWTGVALVIEVAQRKRMYGFVYLPGDDWEAETPDDFDVINRAVELADTMAAGGHRWTRCLVQLTRPGPKVTINFDYDDTGEWVVTPANHAEMVEKLKP
ncbi:hypothetical protein [Sphingomonas sp. DT-204]|uniref:hypothetical protein n=1 Tax=Sphingomonas sp. DT-204 TaxID=3396166 RepID=UPI003F1CA38E